LQSEVNMPMVWVRGRASERVIDVDSRVVGCWLSILRGCCCWWWAAMVDRGKSDRRDIEEWSRRYMVCEFAVSMGGEMRKPLMAADADDDGEA
jgi:hypothetical protein